MPISFTRLQEYLNKIGPTAGNAPHGKFWNGSYQDFVSGNVPGVDCEGAQIPIVNTADFEASAFLTILESADGFCDKPQMPAFGRKVTQPGYSIKLSDGSLVTGTQILRDIHEWLAAKAPERSEDKLS
ncbi:hypothetical protein [Mesorhizobium sp. CO1-1-8]|uniref:hypothetical protein n=1 Tax=Mesorhizobium sp. CO1-1-8 TaxID=2876631 RepID=UPI001CD0B488|nr:hypothetical protein [Mesorhizobium sp. CO1-1-8]MBZ9772256.1 hypothetical protein [Mesorhizobium sp. CO1-1-8]